MFNYRKDDLIFGIIAGILCPAIIYFSLYGLEWLIIHSFSIPRFLDYKKLVMLSLIFNILLFRYYMVKLKFDGTGRGILIVTVVIVLLFFIITL